MKTDNNMITMQLLKFLSKQYPTTDLAITEIINLQAILNLPKATEHYVSDIHGEYETFSHVLRNASGVLRIKIDDIFKDELSVNERRSLAMLIYYPEKKIEKMLQEEDCVSNWYRVNLFRIIKLCKIISSKYTRSKVRKALPKQFAYIMEELLNEQVDTHNKEEYYHEIIDCIIKLNKASEFLCSFCYLIQYLAIDRLHIIGDIFDRGPKAEQVMDVLYHYHSIDIQWGNHDILWMGAAAGSLACIANIIRMACKYSNLETLEDGYGISLLPLATFALNQYHDVNFENFLPETEEDFDIKKDDTKLIAYMHKAITIIQLKLEHELNQTCFDASMKDRNLLHIIDYQNKSILLEGNKYDLPDLTWPTVDKENPYRLTKEEEQVILRLKLSFLHSSKLQEHIRFLFTKGSMYKVYNNNLLYHGCILMNEDGTFKNVLLDGELYSGKRYLDKLDSIVREGFYSDDPILKQKGQDMMWYLWCGQNSPLYGKNKMATFEKYFIKQKVAHNEVKNPYYNQLKNEKLADIILKEFGIDSKTGHIINGHVPVKVKQGENPIKANGKIIVIDGGFTKAYQKVTGIAGYTLINDSRGLKLASHQPFDGVENIIGSEDDIVTTMDMIEYERDRKHVKNTDVGAEIKNQIDCLLTLVEYYQTGKINEHR